MYVFLSHMAHIWTLCILNGGMGDVIGNRGVDCLSAALYAGMCLVKSFVYVVQTVTCYGEVLHWMCT